MGCLTSSSPARAVTTAPVLDSWVRFGVMTAWLAVLLVVAAVLLRNRDA